MAKAKFADPTQIEDEPMESAAQTAIVEPDIHEEIATLAYEFWTQRGCPIGTPEEDWFRAEEEITNRKVFSATAS